MRPYLARGRSQLRLGVKVRRRGPDAAVWPQLGEPWRYYWVGLTWQLPARRWCWPDHLALHRRHPRWLWRRVAARRARRG